MAITTTQVRNIADNIAKTLLDLETDFITNPAGSSPTVATITNGLTAASNSLRARVNALSAGDQLGHIGQNWSRAKDKVLHFLTPTANTLYLLYMDLMLGLDADMGDLAQFLLANSIQVHPEFAAAFNACVTYAVQSGILSTAPTPILPYLIFPPAEVSLATFNVTGASTGTFAAGTAIDTTLYAPQELWLKNTDSSPTTDTNSVLTFTYVDQNGTTHTDGSATLSGALAAGGYIDTGVMGSSVSAISIASGTNGDKFAIVAKLARTVAY